LLLGTPLAAHEPRWLQVLTRADGLLPRRGARVQLRAVYCPINGERARRVRVRERADAVGAHARGELHRLLTIGGVGVAAAAAGAGLGRRGGGGGGGAAAPGTGDARCVRTARADEGGQGSDGQRAQRSPQGFPLVWARR